MENPNTTPAPEQAGNEPPAHSGGIARWLVIGSLGLVAVGGIGVAAAVSQDFMGARFEQAGWGGGGMHGRHGGGGFGGPARIFGELDLTDEQEDKIWAIMDTVRSEARPLMREFRDTREDVAELLGAATIDRAAVEALRADRVAKVDEASKKLTAALADAAEVLTPEQRTKLAGILEDGPRGGPRGRW